MITLFTVLAVLYLAIGFVFIAVSDDISNKNIPWKTQVATLLTWPRYAKLIVDIIRHGF